MRSIVYFIGSLPKKEKTPVGGGEVGNLRTVEMLESFGYKVKLIRKRRSAASESKIKRIILYPLRFLWNLCQCLFVLLFGDRKHGIVHVSGFYGVTIAIETAQVFMAKLFGYRLIYEMRGGGASTYYENGKRSYRKQFHYILNKADYIFSQGQENEPLIQSLCKTPIFYYPNSVKPSFYLEKLPEKPINVVNILFFGRIEPEKNPLMIVEIAALLQKEFDNIRLTIIGNGQKDLHEKVKVAMIEKLKKGTYELLPGCNHDELQQLLVDKHFYVFPSVQPREGQSNAVTEAMSLGIIPIASPQGFSRSTIGDDRLIVQDLNAEAYAERISKIISDDEIEKYSTFVRQRFLDNFTEEIVFARSKNEYDLIFKG